MIPFKLKVIFSSKPTDGGKHQYSIAILEALMLSKNLELEYYSLNSVWDDILEKNNIPFRAIRLNIVISKITFIILKYRLLSLGILRRLLTLTKASRVIRGSHIQGPSLVVSADSFGYLYCTHSIFPVFDLMDSFETFSELENSKVFSWRKVHYKHMVNSSLKLLVDSYIGKEHLSLVYNDIIYKKAHVLPYVAANYIRNVKRKLPHRNSEDSTVRFFYPAQFWSHKNHIIILEAARILIDRGIVDWRIDLLGSEKNSVVKIQEYIYKHDLNNHFFIQGYVSDNEMARYYETYDCLLFASRLGPTNIPPLEARFVGLPAILADCYAMSEIHPGVLHFSSLSSEHLADVMHDFILNADFRYKVAIDAYDSRGCYNLEDFSKALFTICVN